MEDQNKYVLGAQQGDQDALTELYQQTHHMAFFTAMRYVKNEADAADVVQNAYIAAFSKLDTFDPSRGFEPWLRKIVVNQALNFLRGKKVTFVGEDLIEEIMDDDDIVPAHYLEQKEKREKILEIVNDLPDGQRLAITLFYFEEMSIAEIAETMGVKPATAKSHLHFGRKTIKAAILEEERKGNKLYVFLPLPALTRIFHLEAQAARMPEALSQAVWNGITQSSSAFGVSTTPAATPSPKPAAKALTSSASVKIIAGVVTLGVVTSAIVLTRNLSSHQDEAEPAAAVVEEQADREEEASSQEASAEEQVEADPVEEAVPTAFETQWTDTRLEATVREQLSLESGTIMSTDLEAVTSLAFVGPDAVVVNESAEFSYVYEINSETMSITPTTNATLSHYGAISSYEISLNGETWERSDYGTWSNLPDLANFPSLEEVTIAFQTISDEDLEALSSMASLRSLDLTRSRFSSLSFLHSLPQLEELTLSFCEIDDGSPIASLTGLRVLDIQGCGFGDLTVVEGMGGLEELYFNHNQVTDLSPLAGLNNLRYVEANGNQITDLTPLSGKAKLERLYLHNNSAADLTPLAGCTGMKDLGLDRNGISDISPLAGMTGLEVLYLQANSISDISPLAGAVNLEDLSININGITSLEPVAGMQRLDYLNAGQNEISDLSPVAGLSSLRTLRVYNNRIADLTPVAGLTGLEDLNVGGNLISDISPCGGLVNLVSFRMYSNEVSDISAVANMTKLQELNIAHNNVADFSPSYHVPEITY